MQGDGLGVGVGCRVCGVGVGPSVGQLATVEGKEEAAHRHSPSAPAAADSVARQSCEG